MNVVIKQARSYDVRFHGIFVPKNALYGTVNFSDNKVPFCVPIFPSTVSDSLKIRVYSYDSDHWYFAKYERFKSLYNAVVQFISKNNLIGVKTKEHLAPNGIASTYQFDVPTGKPQKITGLINANKAYGKRGDGAGTLSYSGTLYDTVRRKNGELDYNFYGRKFPIIMDGGY